MIACNCSETLSNTGQAGCQPIFTVTKKYIIVPTYDSTGTKNSLPIGTPLTQVDLDALTNQTDPTKRWYPLPEVQNVAGERAESQFEESAGGKKSFIKQGTRNVTAEIWDESPTYKAQLDKIRCNPASVYIIDANGNIRGIVPTTEDGNLYPIRIDKQSWDVRVQFATDTTVEKLLVSYDFDQTEDDAQLRMIASSDIPADLLEANGLLDITVEYSDISVNGFTAELSTIYGSLSDLLKDSGLVAGDFFDFAGGTSDNVYNVTQVGAEPLASVTETAVGSGKYVFVYTTPVLLSDVIRLTPVKNGRDYSLVIAKTFVTV